MALGDEFGAEGKGKGVRDHGVDEEVGLRSIHRGTRRVQDIEQFGGGQRLN